ncbi:MAG TPA: permease prefix domain 1-containing protein [Acidimicrobiia bacterium]|nr:permease prefix domain 1-containing protein [Acidimicrobiia bacterium]
MESLEPSIAEWRTHVSQANGVNGHDVEELETHLREQIADLGAAGLSDDEAFLVAVKRLGDVDEMSREFALEHSGRLWRQFTVAQESGERGPSAGLLRALALAVLAAIAIQIPRLAGLDSAALETFYARNASLLVLPFLAWLYIRERRLTFAQIVLAAAPFVIAAVAVNLYPWIPGSASEVVVNVHLPVALWFAVGYTHMGGMWRSHERRMDFVRFTGEWFIYYVLIALGGGVLIALTSFILEPTGPETVQAVLDWVIPSGAAGAVIIAAWLVEGKKSVVENMAPVLTSIFTPLFAVMLAASSVLYLVSDLASEFNREAIFVLDVLLVVVLGLVVYDMSAREETKPPGLMDRIQLVAVVSALLLDLIVLSSMIARIGEFGFTPNRVAALGLNLVLLVNLIRAGWLSVRFVSNKSPFHHLERWQTAYLPVYGLWSAAVVLILPLVFEFA